MSRLFIKTNGEHLVAVGHIVSVDYRGIADLRLLIVDANNVEYEVTGLEAIETAMLLNPACLEGQRLRWPKCVWAFHNLVAHPAMQVLAFAKKYKLAFWLHDVTVPRPKGRR